MILQNEHQYHLLNASIDIKNQIERLKDNPSINNYPAYKDNTYHIDLVFIQKIIDKLESLGIKSPIISSNTGEIIQAGSIYKSGIEINDDALSIILQLTYDYKDKTSIGLEFSAKAQTLLLVLIGFCDNTMAQLRTSSKHIHETYNKLIAHKLLINHIKACD